MWTQFMDMHSGGGQKLDWAYIYIEAPEAEAAVIFQNRFGRNPHRVTCTCCGNDYSLTESETLEEATGYERGCSYAYVDENGREYSQDEAWVSGKGIVIPGVKGKYIDRAATDDRFSKTYKPLDEYLRHDHILVIRASEIKPEERQGELQEEGYVWR